MVNWDEAGKTWPQPHPHAVRLLRGLLWGQQYRHSNPQCEGGMPGSFQLREAMVEDRLRAVEEWLRVEGYAYRFRRKGWRVWTRPDRPGEGLRPDGIEEDEKPNEYPSGATINVSMGDMIEKEFPELGNARTLQGSSSSSASPGKEKRSAGDRKRDWKWREYQESLAAKAAQGATGGTPAHSPQRASGGHHPGHTTLGDFLEVAKQAKAKPRPLLLMKSGPSSDVESAQRERMPADQASSSSSVAPGQRDVARACERTCWVPCNLWVAWQRATQRNASVEGAVGIAGEEAAEWGRGMAFHPSTVAAIAAGLTAAAAHEAATAEVKGEVAAAAEEARLTQEAIARKEAEVKALEDALAQERARKEAEERAHAEATAKAQADAARKDAIEAARRKVAEERAKTEAELEAFEAEKARLQQTREAEAARAQEEAEGRAAAATAAAMAEAEAKLRRETPPGGSRVETLRKITLLPTGARSLPRAGPRRPGGATWTRMMTWTHPRTHRGDPAETHRDPLAEDHQDPLEDAHQVDPLEASHRAGEDPLDSADSANPAEALLEDPLGPPTTHQGTATRPPPGGGLSPLQEGPVPRARGRHGQGRDDSHRQGRRGRTEGAGHRQDRDGQDHRGRHCRAEGAGHRQGRDQAAEQGHQRPAAAVGRAGRPWERRQRPPTPGVWLVGRQLGTWTRSRQTPRPRRSPQEWPQRQCPLSQRPLSPQRGPPQRARAARQWQ